MSERGCTNTRVATNQSTLEELNLYFWQRTRADVCFGETSMSTCSGSSSWLNFIVTFGISCALREVLSCLVNLLHNTVSNQTLFKCERHVQLLCTNLINQSVMREGELSNCSTLIQAHCVTFPAPDCTAVCKLHVVQGRSLLCWIEKI